MFQLKSLRWLAILLLCLPACSTQPKRTALEPVGPAPRNRINPDNQGTLVVYSAWSNFVDQGSTGHHSRYTITSDVGAMSKEVINHVDRFDEGPVRLSIAAGAYHVSARSAHFGRVNVPVIIKPRQTTFVYLDGAPHLDAPSTRQPNTVRLPDGEVIGWSATVADN